MPWTKSEIQNFYDSYAKSYDLETSKETYPSPFILSCWLLEKLQEDKHDDTLKKKTNILDVGCGTGQSSSLFFAQGLVEDSMSYNVVGVDASPNMLQIAGKYPFKSLMCIDIEKELLEKTKEHGPYHGLICVGVIDFIQDVPNLLLNFRNLLSDDGFAVLTLPETPNDDLNYFTEEQMHDMIEKAGLIVEKSERLFGYQDSENGKTTYYTGFLLRK